MAANGTPEQPDSNQPPASQPSGGRAFNISIKWLLIGGGGAGAVLLAVVAVVALFLTGVIGGSGGEGGGGASGGGNVLAYIPSYSEGVVFIANNQAVLNGDVPEDYIEYLEESGDEDDESSGISTDAYEAIDIKDDEVAVYAAASSSSSLRSSWDLEIVKGNFRYDIIREELEDGLNCEDDDYRGYELWECPGGEFPAVALFEDDGIVVFAVARQTALEQMLTYKSRTPERLASASGSPVQEILAQAGGGWLQFAFITEDCVIERCEGIAFALQNSADSDSIPASYAIRFSSERAAASAQDDIAIDDFLEETYAGLALELDIGEVVAQGEFVVGNGITEFVEPKSESEPTPTPPPSRTDWINHCYDFSPTLSRRNCSCVHDYLRDDGYHPVPRWELDWERGAGIGAEAVIQCYRRGGVAPAQDATPTLDPFAGVQSPTPTAAPAPTPTALQPAWQPAPLPTEALR